MGVRLEADQVIPGTDQIIVDGGVDLSQEPIWIEAPHIFKKDERYFLICAEGGTGDWHSEVVFVSDHPKGPYKPAPGNPILSQRYLSDNRANKVDWAGHADLVTGPDGNYYGVFLGVRPNEENRVNTGRETFILPVDWSGDFPVFVNGLTPLSPKLKMPSGVTNLTGTSGFFPNGNFTFTETFSSADLDPRWVSLRGPREDFISNSTQGLIIDPYQVNIKEVKPTSTLFHRQQHRNFSFSTSLTYKPANQMELAGIVCLQSESFNYVFGVTRKDGDYYMVLQKTQAGESTLVASEQIDLNGSVDLAVRATGDKYEFGYRIGDGEFTYFEVSGDILSTNVAGGFSGNLIGLHATTANDIKPLSN